MQNNTFIRDLWKKTIFFSRCFQLLNPLNGPFNLFDKVLFSGMTECVCVCVCVCVYIYISVEISLRLQGKLSFPYNVKQIMIKCVLLC